MIEATDIITFLKNYSNPTTQFLFAFDFSGLETFIVPEKNLYSLVMLSKAREQGLDIVFVDKSKFFDNAMLRIQGNMLNGQGPFEGAWYIEFQLSPVLLHGQTFEFVDYSESMGYGFMLNAMNLGNEIVDHFVSQAGKVHSGIWYAEDVQTLEQLSDYINKVITQPEPKDNKFAKYSRKDVVITALTLVVFAMLAGSYFILKAT
jgi:hypothetical protein